MVEPLKKVLDLEFDEAVTQVEKIVVEEGFTHMMTKSIDGIIKEKLEVKDYPRYTIILVCNPTFAKEALDASKENILLFPCSFAVYEDEGKVWVGHVSVMKTSPAIGLSSPEAMEPLSEMVSKTVHDTFQRF
jgi:uncharacterized protein (DUF302 family)